MVLFEVSFAYWNDVHTQVSELIEWMEQFSAYNPQAYLLTHC